MLKKSLVVALLAVGGMYGVTTIAASVPVPATLAALPAAPLTKAKSTSPLTVVLSVQKIVIKDGKEQRIDATNAAPGDLLEYRTEYKNTSATAVGKALLTLPLPEHTTYVDGSALPAGMTASNRSAITDFRAPPLLQQVPGDAIGALRWAFDKLLPGKTIVISARVRVNATDAIDPIDAGGVTHAANASGAVKTDMQSAPASITPAAK